MEFGKKNQYWNLPMCSANFSCGEGEKFPSGREPTEVHLMVGWQGQVLSAIFCCHPLKVTRLPLLLGH